MSCSSPLRASLLVRGAVLLALGLSATGCATITRGTNDVFVVETDPIGASVVTTNGFKCSATPCTFKMPRKSDFDVTISKPGYKTWTGHVTNKVAGGGGAAMAGNVLVGGIIGAVVDGNNGSMLDLVPNPLVVKLEPGEDAPESGSASGVGN